MATARSAGNLDLSCHVHGATTHVSADRTGVPALDHRLSDFKWREESRLSLALRTSVFATMI